MRSGSSAAMASKLGSSVSIISGSSSYPSSTHSPSPLPPTASQSLAPTGWTPSARAVSASDQPSATTRVGSSSIWTSPNAVLMVTGKAPDEAVAVPSASEPESSPEPQLDDEGGGQQG